MHRRSTRILLLVMSLLTAMLLLACSGSRAQAPTASPFRIALFIPGNIAGNPEFELLTMGADRVAKEHGNVVLTTVEGGYNDAEWSKRLADLATSGQYNLIVTAKPVMAQACANLSASHPKLKFLVFDAYLAGNRSIHTVLFNRREEAFLAGYFAGMVTTSPKASLKRANPNLVAGLLVGQRDPLMDKVISKAYELGLKVVNPAISLDYRELGNWFDEAKAGELARSMIAAGADVILTVAGAGNAGVVNAAKDAGAYVVWFDSSGNSKAPGVVIGSATIAADRAAYEKIGSALAGKLAYGEAVVLGVKAGYVGFDQKNSHYRKDVPHAIQTAISAMMERMTSGSFRLEMPISF
ncbi:MAG TPA: BMP family ABC transporter substrate-binding protein [Spirochaetia bacterium]|nr:BMP family ABC transporter substrate-binding protein [Spirochaetia bacterium]